MTEITFANGLRVEAQPVEFAQLSWSQVQASEKVAGALLGAYKQSKEELEGANQRNQILMISGSKGAGKTTLVLSLRQWYRDLGLLGYEEGDLKNSQFHKDDPALQDYKSHGSRLHDLIKGCRDKVVWLDTLSLDPLHRGTNFVAAIFARITHAIARNNDREQLNRGILDPVSATDRAFHELGSLKSDAVLALEGNLDNRAAGMDTESYAIAATESERKKHETAARLNKALRRLLEGSRISQEPSEGLFVLPIDDMDSCPERAVEMLKLAYSLSVPRLIFIFLGSIEVTDQTLFYQIQGQFQGLLKERGDDARHALEATANNIASSTLRKMIPPSQRIILEPLTLERATRFTPGGMNKGKTLKLLLEDIQVISAEGFFTGEEEPSTSSSMSETATQPAASTKQRGADEIKHKTSMASLLFAKDPFSRITIHSKTIPDFKDYIYDGLRILQAAPRHLADLHALTSETNFEPKELIQELFAEAFCTLVDEDGDLTPPVQRKLKTCLHRDPFSDEIELTPPSLKLVSETGDRLRFEDLPAMDGTRKASLFCTVEAVRVRELELEAMTPGRVIPPRLSPPTRSTFKVIHDLIRINNVGVITEPIDHADLKKIAFTRWDDGINKPFRIPWISTKWKTFWHTDAFFRLWNHGHQTIRTVCRERSQLHAEDLTYLLALTLAASLVMTAKARVPEGSVDWWAGMDTPLRQLLKAHPKGAANASTGWTYSDLGVESAHASICAAAKKLVLHAAKKKERGEDDDEADHIKEVLINLLLLGAPECGVPEPTGATGFSKLIQELRDLPRVGERSDDLVKLWDEITRKVRRLRVQRLREHASSFLGLRFLNPSLIGNDPTSPPNSGALEEQGSEAGLIRLLTGTLEPYPGTSPTHTQPQYSLYCREGEPFCPSKHEILQAVLAWERKGFTRVLKTEIEQVKTRLYSRFSEGA